ncbi:MAG TPA: methyltransferase domain-containing protein [Pyrinomonadaceae bacterium]
MKALARKSKTAIIASKLYTNWRMRRSRAKGSIEAAMGSTHSRKTIDESLAYIEAQYADYCQYAQLTPETIRGKRIVELGCGDNVGVALKFLADGAEQVVCVDKFYSVRDVEKERMIYVELRKTLSPLQQDAFDRAVDLSGSIKLSEQRLRCVYGIELSDFADTDTERAFDVVLSRAVIEEIYEPDSLFAAADKLLRPDGLMIHKIDLSDYGMFSNGGMNPLTFLTIPEWLYRRMASESAIPNRKLISYYRELMTRMGYEARIFVSSIIGFGEIVPHKLRIEPGADYGVFELSLIEKIRPKLQSEFASMTDGELLVNGIFLVARK